MLTKIIPYEFDTMTEELLQHLGVSLNGLAIKGETLFNLVQSLPEPAHVKDAKTGKYICSNKSNLEVYGLNDISRILGKTVHDLDNFMKPYWGDTFARNISTFDAEVCKSKEVIQEIGKIFIAVNGVIHIQDITKAPVFKGNEVFAIFTHSHDKTDSVDLLELFKIYQEVYDRELDARKNFCEYLKITSFFSEAPSVHEIEFLLYARNNRQLKDVASKMHKSVSSLEKYRNSINYNMRVKNKKFDYKNVVDFIVISRSSSIKL